MTYKFSVESYDLPTPADSDIPGPSWMLDWSRAILLVHDMQNYFVRPIPEIMKNTLVNNISSLIELARSSGADIAYTGQPGRMTQRERGLLRDFWGDGMNSTDVDRQIIKEATPEKDDIHLTKWRYSAYTRTSLSEELIARKRDQLVICGVYTHVGILATAIDSLAHDIECFVIADATVDFSRVYHLNALGYISERCGKVLYMEDII